MIECLTATATATKSRRSCRITGAGTGDILEWHDPAAELATLYQQHWEIETNLRHLKQTLRMEPALPRSIWTDKVLSIAT